MSGGFGPADRLERVALTEAAPLPRTPEMQQELDVALFDLAEDNRFRPAGQVEAGPFSLGIGLEGRHLALEIAAAAGPALAPLRLPLAPFREAIEDYAAITERYFDAVRALPRAEIEALDQTRREIHDEGARLLVARLDGAVETDHATARRLFTVICALSQPG
ncbi:UPF0262 family protein [Paralimibaculum aggregatum]|uniref:UPF0262 family protein n=1 Tax=Paralimibaculum aggregatum TaxID=3036245 RepID=A0ABQ6LM74_9RHOB|nr:UPF0262 family protein [Limibaculum sp. NKW23]GMG83390.1 UPF0262 family protein [Limibaculum sp. NKW23]